jgi:uncharacterized protein YqkB
MEFEYGPLILKSQDRLRMTDLLTDVFEFEVDTENHCLALGPWRVRLIDSQVTDVFEQCVVFEFYVFSQDDLNEISSKFHFFLYRKSDSIEVKEKMTIVENDSYKILSVIDLDKREWQFKLKLKD